MVGLPAAFFACGTRGFKSLQKGFADKGVVIRVAELLLIGIVNLRDVVDKAYLHQRGLPLGFKEWVLQKNQRRIRLLRLIRRSGESVQ